MLSLVMLYEPLTSEKTGRERIKQAAKIRNDDVTKHIKM